MEIEIERKTKKKEETEELNKGAHPFLGRRDSEASRKKPDKWINKQKHDDQGGASEGGRAREGS